MGGRRPIVGYTPVGSCVDLHVAVDREFPGLVPLFTSRQWSFRRLVRRVKQLERFRLLGIRLEKTDWPVYPKCSSRHPSLRTTVLS
jgi:hypothetical protein